MKKIINYINSLYYDYQPTEYKINCDFIIDDSVRKSIEQDGYVIIENIVSDDEINIITGAFKTMTEDNEFKYSFGFSTSTNYGYKIQQNINNILSNFNTSFLKKIVKIDKVYHNLINILAFKFGNSKEGLFPHQDMSLVDEEMGSTIFAWIPTEDITPNNGALMVLPKSHKWFRWQKTHNQLDTPLRKLHNEIYKSMIPLYINKGDIILFDSSLIHASSPNNTNKTRICMNTSFAPNNIPLVNYQDIPNNKMMIYKYLVDENFYKKFFQNPNIIPDNYLPPIKENRKCIYDIPLMNFKSIINKN